MLTERGKQLRRDTIKLSKANGGYHWGGVFSCVEILSVLYDRILQPSDAFILSKGHACWTYYKLLQEKGFNPVLAGHPYREIMNGVCWTTGSEGHGFPAAVGLALARKHLGNLSHVYVLLGDGECQEGTTWESLLLGARYGLSNLTVIVDNNRAQGSGFTENILPIPNLDSIVTALGWEAMRIDGHNEDTLEVALRHKSVQPKFIVAETVKGKGVSFMENDPKWHACWLADDQEAIAMEELL